MRRWLRRVGFGRFRPKHGFCDPPPPSKTATVAVLSVLALLLKLIVGAMASER
jgi:hypothetical protein